MLLRFRLENSRSFKDECELSMVQSNLSGPSAASSPIPLTLDEVLPCALVYGSNASGKSNLLRGAMHFRNAVLYSHSRGDPDGGVPRIPFALRKNADQPTSYESDFIANGVRYTYGFSCDDDVFLEEWLYGYPEGKRRILFERNGSDVEFGSKFSGPKKQLVEFMRPNSLFIATATQNDHPVLSSLVKQIGSWRFFSKNAVSDQEINQSLGEQGVDSRVLQFLEFVGSGVVDFESVSIEVPEEVRGLHDKLSKVIAQQFGDDVALQGPDEKDRQHKLRLGHRGERGETYFLGLKRESSGTRRVLLMMSRIFKALDEGATIFVDELDASLHTLAAEEIIKLFQDRRTNSRGAQLIATTHDTNLLSYKGIRRDQIWFCERDSEGGSDLYSLAELKSRQTDNFEKGYLEGRYGGIPYAGDVSLLFGVEQ